MFRVGATLAVVPVRTTKKGPGKISMSLRGVKRRGDRRECLWCNPVDLLGLPMVDTARFQGLDYNHGPTGRAFGSFAAIMCRTVTVVTGTTARVAPTRFWGITP